MAQLLLTVLGLVQLDARLAYAKISNCRCLSTDSCWPSQQDFAILQTQLSQPFITPIPPAAACYPPDAPLGNCTDVQQNWFDPAWSADHPGQMQAPNWETFIFSNGTIEQCLKNATLGFPCGQGSVPVLGVDARTPEDIQAAINFSVQHNLRVVVKNTGHDFLGRSMARGAFMLWTHNMKNISYHDTFTPTGALGTSNATLKHILTIGAGVQWHEAYDASYAQDRDIVGAPTAKGSVGSAGGWIGGGGHSVLAPTFGLGADNAVQFTIVTSTGEHLTANNHQHSDLFWALRGGGGGTYGIVTSVSYQTHPAELYVRASFSATVNTTNTTAPSAPLKALFTEFVRITPFLSDNGWAGYPQLTLASPTNEQTFSFVLLNTHSWTDANATIDPFFDYARSLAATTSSVQGGDQFTVVNAGTVAPQLFRDFERQVVRPGESETGVNIEVASRLLPRKLLEDDYVKVADTLLAQSPAVSYIMVAGGAVAKVDPDSAGINPAWREALVHVATGQTWVDGTPLTEIVAAKERVKAYTLALENLAPGSGSYFNEASLYCTDPKQTFFGSHYEKLLDIKKTYDPHDLFIVAEGVGSEEWDASLNCRV
ncbi:FAD-binding domain-containing protein [Irpex rosettiformis]|uniref:FAD-binding domain-containing protein n=1 Tax=Irpex rosettiformis TaxID=378272 RepID=A0ACB8UKJ6_9APHY|nr:FAD-binding domain-containing protein [Irpex rosettiformis]